MTRLAKILLFTSSFSPLFLLLAVRFLDRGLAPFVLAFLGVSAGAAGYGLMTWSRGGQRITFVIDSVENRSESLTGYLVGYLFPFLVLDPSDILTVIATLLFGLLLAFIYVEGNLVYLNPLLVIRGRHIWHVEAHRRNDTSDSRTLILLADRDILRVNQCVATTGVAGDVRIGDVVNCDD